MESGDYTGSHVVLVAVLNEVNRASSERGNLRHQLFIATLADSKGVVPISIILKLCCLSHEIKDILFFLLGNLAISQQEYSRFSLSYLVPSGL